MGAAGYYSPPPPPQEEEEELDPLSQDELELDDELPESHEPKLELEAMKPLASAPALPLVPDAAALLARIRAVVARSRSFTDGGDVAVTRRAAGVGAGDRGAASCTDSLFGSGTFGASEGWFFLVARLNGLGIFMLASFPQKTRKSRFLSKFRASSAIFARFG